MYYLQLTKSSSESDLKRYFTAVLELSKAEDRFPSRLIKCVRWSARNNLSQCHNVKPKPFSRILDEDFTHKEVLYILTGTVIFIIMLGIVGTLEKGGLQ